MNGLANQDSTIVLWIERMPLHYIAQDKGKWFSKETKSKMPEDADVGVGGQG